MIRRTATIFAFITVFAAGAWAQKITEVHPGSGGSPHVRAEWSIQGAMLSIEYGRPYVKGRKIMGELVPYGQVWRTGADQATTLVTSKALEIGGVAVPAGTYTLYTLPAADGWKLIVNRQTKQWGTDYDAKQDLARIDMKVEKLPAAVEQLTISVDPQPGGGLLKIEWENTRASVPFKVRM